MLRAGAAQLTRHQRTAAFVLCFPWNAFSRDDVLCRMLGIGDVIGNDEGSAVFGMDLEVAPEHCLLTLSVYNDQHDLALSPGSWRKASMRRASLAI
jgi:hypothetical protein